MSAAGEKRGGRAGHAPTVSGPGRKPPWLRVKVAPAHGVRATSGVLDDLGLHTVCDEARCPNRGECFASGTATFLVLGDRCTRDCGFCAVAHGVPQPPDPDEPRRVGEAAARLGLDHVVVTSVTRDDLPDGGAAQFAATIAAVRAAAPGATVEVLIPDLGGASGSLATVLSAAPDVLNHNLETVPRLYRRVRPGADYAGSLTLLRRAAAEARAATRARAATDTPAARDDHGRGSGRPLVKTGLMVGLGEELDEVRSVLADCAAAGVDAVTIGQYLQPGPGRLPVVRYVRPHEFDLLRRSGDELGLTVVADPLVRSSYRAADLVATG